MNATQCKAFMDAVEAAEITTFTFDSDLSSHFRNDGKRNIVKPDYDKECMVAFRANHTFGGSEKTFDPNIEVIVSDFGDIHEVRTAGNYEQIKAFIESFGGIDMTDDDFKILLEVDGANYNINPVTGDYVNAFHYLSKKEYDALTPEEQEAYDEAKAVYEKAKASYLPPHTAGMVM